MVKKIKSFLVSILVMCAITLLLGELAFRIIGKSGHTIKEISTVIEPGNTFYQIDSTLGYKHISGDFTVHLSDSFSWNTTHLKTSRRITKPLNQYKIDQDKPSIWFMGCSFTHGWSLNNNETFPWLIQERFPEYHIENFGIGGHGILQALLQLKQELAINHKPKLIFLCYASFHDERNVLLSSWRKSLSPNQKLGKLSPPYARVSEGKLKIDYAEKLYTPWPLNKYSALINTLEDTYYQYEDYLINCQDVTKAIINEIKTICKEQEITFVLTNIHNTSNTKKVSDYVKKMGVNVTDISVDLTLKQNNNLPHDGHPSAKANFYYANKLELYIRSLTKEKHLGL